VIEFKVFDDETGNLDCGEITIPKMLDLTAYQKTVNFKQAEP
jgi:hypothetical protein